MYYLYFETPALTIVKNIMIVKSLTNNLWGIAFINQTKSSDFTPYIFQYIFKAEIKYNCQFIWALGIITCNSTKTEVTRFFPYLIVSLLCPEFFSNFFE